MPLYRYRAVDPQGRKRTGHIDAPTPADLEHRLARMALELIEGHPLSEAARHRANRLPRRERLYFCQQLDLLIRAGIPLRDGLIDLRDTVDDRQLRAVVTSLTEAVEEGRSLSQAMAEQADVFNAVFVSLISAGETTGRLTDILENLIETLKWEDELMSQTRTLLLYPAFVGSIVLLAAAFLTTTVVPQLTQLIRASGQALPIHTQALLFTSDLLIGYWPLILLLPVAIGCVIHAVLRISPTARYFADGLALRLPMAGEILRKIILSRFIKTFALLYASGIPILDAIRTTQGVVGNGVIRHALEHVEQSLNEGTGISAAFQETGLFPPLILRMMRLGEHTGALDHALLNVSYFHDREIRASVQKIQVLIEPALTVLLGLLLGWIMLSVLAPVYDLISILTP